MIRDISVVIITRNAAATLETMLVALSRFDDIVIYDNGSRDNTLSVAKRHSNVRLFQGEFLGFGPTKRHAVSLAANDWILSLDADETLDDELLHTLERWDTSPQRNAAGEIRRNNLLLGKVVRHSGWGNDWLVRLFNRRFCNFSDAMVHEAVETSTATRITRLEGGITHQAVTDLSQFLAKVNHYSSIRAKHSRRSLHPALILGKAIFAFFRTYTLRLGFLDGWRGLVIAFSNANGVFWKHMKAYSVQHSDSEHQD